MPRLIDADTKKIIFSGKLLDLISSWLRVGYFKNFVDKVVQ